MYGSKRQYGYDQTSIINALILQLRLCRKEDDFNTGVNARLQFVMPSNK